MKKIGGDIELLYFTLAGNVDGNNNNLDNYMFFPFEDSGFTYASDFSSVVMGVASKDGSDPRQLKAVHDLYTRLYTREGYRYNYFFNTGTDMLKTQTTGNNLKTQEFLNLAIISLLVVTVGLTGLIAALTNRRRRELAICLSVGATKIRLAFEIITESLLITLTGGICGCGTGWFIISMDLFKFDNFIVDQNYIVIIACILISVIISIIGSLFPLIKIKKMMPMEVLREG
jgi:putative ABC transport system permease protein